MPRKARIVVPGAFHHLMARGIDGREIFTSDEDREQFLTLLERLLRCHSHRLHAWVLMPNHYHLLLRSSDRPLSEMMKQLNSAYARYFNRKANRRGYLFQDRYKSVVTQDQRYVEEILRYVHLNPVRSGLCKDLDALKRYRWCGHGVLMGARSWNIQAVKETLARFGNSPAFARRAYVRYLQERLRALEQESDDSAAVVRRSNSQVEDMFDPGCWVIGDAVFVRSVMKAHQERGIRLARYRTEGVTLDEVAAKVSQMSGIVEERLRRRSRGSPVSEARKLFAHVARHEYGFPVREIGRYLGIGSSPASICIAKGEKIASGRKFLIH